jgi:hypothetical protein
MTQIKKVNVGKDIIEPAICKALELKPSPINTIGYDGINKYGTKFEIKFFSTGNRPSFTGLLVDFEKSLEQNFEERLFAQKYVLVFSQEEIKEFFPDEKATHIDNLSFVVLTKAQFVKWALPRTILDKSSKGKWQFRLNKYPRTKHQTEKMRAKGLL